MKTESEGQALRVSLVKPVAYLSSSYFAKPLVLNGQIQFLVNQIEADGNWHNQIMNPVVGTATAMPGVSDIVASSDGELLTSLLLKLENQDVNAQVGGVAFYSGTKAMNGEISNIYEDRDLIGVYQSIGKSPKPKAGESSYRVLVDRVYEQEGDKHPEIKNARLAVRDYSYRNGRLRPNGKIQYPCQGKMLQTPFMSKDGTKVAAFDVESNTTKIFALDGKCTMIKDLGFRTGKVDFSEDGQKLAFYIEDVESGNTGIDGQGYTNNVNGSGGLVSNIFVLDLKSGARSQITRNFTSYSYLLSVFFGSN